MKVGLVGATGQVGRELLKLLEARRFPLKELRIFASRASRGRTLPFRGRSLPLRNPGPAGFKDLDLVFFSTEGEVTRRWAFRLASGGCWVIDDSALYRMHPKVPLVIPEINGEVLSPRTRLIAGPNCTTAQMLLAIFPVHRRVPIRKIRMATYQSVSGAGSKAVSEMKEQFLAWAGRGRFSSPRVLPQRIAFNLFPQIGAIGPDGYSGEEVKIAQETRKILGAVRVPVVRGHSEAIWLETAKPVSVSAARRWISGFSGLELFGARSYPMPIHAEGRWPVCVGRIRKDPASRSGLVLWVVGDNLLKGAALNSVQIAEFLLRKRYLGRLA